MNLEKRNLSPAEPQQPQIFIHWRLQWYTLADDSWMVPYAFLS